MQDEKFVVKLVRFPGDETEHMDCVTWLMGMPAWIKGDPNVKAFGTACYADTPITMTRNRAVKDARAEGIDYLMMVDNDIIPDYLFGIDPTALAFWDVAWGYMMRRRAAELAYFKASTQCNGHLVENEAQLKELAQGALEAFPPAVVGAPYCGPPPEENCYVFHWKTFESDSPLEKFALQMIEREDAARRAGLEEVAALPTGLILFDMRVFDHLPCPWFDYEWADTERSQKASTEDVFMTRNARLGPLSCPLVCAWDSWAQHVKRKRVRKPSVLYSDQVQEHFAEAVRKGWKKGERLLFKVRE